MEPPPTPATPALLSEKNWQYYSIAVRLFLSAIVILGFVRLFWAAVSAHDTESAATFGWLLVPAIWLVSSAYGKWRKISAIDKSDPQLKVSRIINRVAIGSLAFVILGSSLAIAIPLQKRQARFRRVEQVLKQAQSDIPVATQTRLNFNSIMSRDVRTFAEFQQQCSDLRVALEKNDRLAVKKKALWEQLGRELDDPNALSLLDLYRQMSEEDGKASATLRSMMSCADVLGRADSSQRNKFESLCVQPAQAQLILSAASTQKLLQEVQKRGAKLPPDLVNAMK